MSRKQDLFESMYWWSPESTMQLMITIYPWLSVTDFRSPNETDFDTICRKKKHLMSDEDDNLSTSALALWENRKILWHLFEVILHQILLHCKKRHAECYLDVRFHESIKRDTWWWSRNLKYHSPLGNGFKHLSSVNSLSLWHTKTTAEQCWAVSECLLL